VNEVDNIPMLNLIKNCEYNMDAFLSQNLGFHAI